MRNREANYTTLLMATGLTFGTISALFGLQNKIIDQSQYTILVTVVILSAFVPTLIAQKFFQPTIETMVEWGKIYSERINNETAPTGANWKVRRSLCSRKFWWVTTARKAERPRSNAPPSPPNTTTPN
jgi:Kef-type K+ transport system membrane component KefB